MKKILTLLSAVIFAAGLMGGLYYYMREETSKTMSAEEKNGVFLPILMYHNITDKATGSKYTVTAAELESDLKYITEKGYTTIGAEELIDYAKGLGELPEKPIMLTFDDGYESVYSLALPLFEKYNAKGVVGIIGELTELFSQSPDHNISYSHLTREEINEMNKSGFFEFQNHTFALHENENGRKGADKKKNEDISEYGNMLLEDCRKLETLLLETTGHKPRAFIYPFGSFSSDSEAILKEVGYEATFSCTEKPNYISSPDDLWLLNRYLRPSGISSYEVFEKFEKLKGEV